MGNRAPGGGKHIPRLPKIPGTDLPKIIIKGIDYTQKFLSLTINNTQGWLSDNIPGAKHMLHVVGAMYPDINRIKNGIAFVKQVRRLIKDGNVSGFSQFVPYLDESLAVLEKVKN